VISTQDVEQSLNGTPLGPVVDWLHGIPDKAAAAAAGLPGERAHRALVDRIDRALGDFNRSIVPHKPASRRDPDLEAMTPIELKALQLNLQTEKLEIERALNQGALVRVRDAYSTSRRS
jgi:hypothetical protein